MIEFLKILVSYFDENKIPYMLSGSVAMSIYALPRFTRSFDFIVHLQPKGIPGLLEHFKDNYYCDEDAVKEAIANKGMFNIIDHKSSYKADFMILKNEPYRLVEFERRTQISFLEMEIFLVSPEDLLISKIIWIQQSKSALQIEDIKALSAINTLDRDYINKWVLSLKLNTFNII